ncbi:MAG: hypothetical protein ACN4GW_08060 [Desulforhopalus sp.]
MKLGEISSHIFPLADQSIASENQSASKGWNGQSIWLQNHFYLIECALTTFK